MDYTKSMIQQALWEAYKHTGDEEYRRIYQQWYDRYERIRIEGLEGR